jgi:DNA-binding MarR family transcriptional regulator
VRKGHIDQSPTPDDQRQRILQLTESGTALWLSLPDPIALILDVAFSDADTQAVDAARDVMRAATERLLKYQTKGNTE